MVAVDRMLEITQPGGTTAYLLPWYVRAIVPTATGCLVFLPERDVWEATESAAVIAQRILDANAPDPE